VVIIYKAQLIDKLICCTASFKRSRLFSVILRSDEFEPSLKIFRYFFGMLEQFNRYLSRFFQKPNYKGGTISFTYTLRTHYAIF